MRITSKDEVEIKIYGIIQQLRRHRLIHLVTLSEIF